MFDGCTAEQLRNAIAAVSGGSASAQQIRWVQAAAKNAGSTGSDARAALKASGQNAR